MRQSTQLAKLLFSQTRAFDLGWLRRRVRPRGEEGSREREKPGFLSVT
jgi:hypothetical protein